MSSHHELTVITRRNIYNCIIYSSFEIFVIYTFAILLWHSEACFIIQILEHFIFLRPKDGHIFWNNWILYIYFIIFVYKQICLYIFNIYVYMYINEHICIYYIHIEHIHIYNMYTYIYTCIYLCTYYMNIY